MSKFCLLLTILGLTACAPLPDRLALDSRQSTLQLQPRVSSVLVRNLSLPSYAAAEEIPRETTTGLITTSGILWADDPQRASTLALSGHLGQILSVDAGAEPWPFLDLPDVVVDIRVSRMIAAADGQFYLTGQAFIGGDGRPFRNSVIPFDIRHPLPDQSLTSIAAAQSAALLALAETIARQLARPSSE
jgi:uncharacterized protein